MGRVKTQAGSEFTMAKLIKLNAKVAIMSRNILVGIVCRPECSHVIRDLMQQWHKPVGFWLDTPVYEDSDQEDPWIPFYDRNLLKQYLSRNAK